MQNKIKIDVNSSDIIETLRESLWILFKLRHHSKKWKDNYGFQNRDRMNYWEEKADEFLEKVIKTEKSE